MLLGQVVVPQLSLRQLLGLDNENLCPPQVGIRKEEDIKREGKIINGDSLCSVVWRWKFQEILKIKGNVGMDARTHCYKLNVCVCPQSHMLNP